MAAAEQSVKKALLIRHCLQAERTLETAIHLAY
jgi:hypothetical protein